MTSFDSARFGRKGFTLIELMIVVVIIGVLAAIAIPKFANVSKAAKEAEAQPILKQLFTLQERFKQKNDEYASDIAQLEGGTATFANAKYYTFQIDSGDGATYLACAQPTLDGLRWFSINAAREITPHDSGCT
ncbi:MAG TPA: prepilin-type N-terminal cleavage/methylation domain-containing protein [Longimicrobium sp.]|jgi:prepilin-type N-terminal cleavage/methylation domain-containing protein